MTGHVNDATEDLTHQPEDFTVVIIGDGEERIPALMETIASPYVSGAIESGATVTVEMITPLIWKRDWGNKAFRDLRFGRTRIKGRTTS